MKRLFVMDLKNYDENWVRSARPSVRGIIDCGDQFALIHNTVIPKSIEEFGSALIIRKSFVFENMIFEQENLYYYCRADKNIGETKLESYEIEDGLKLEFMSLEKAIEHNRSIDPKTVRNGDADWIDRETRIMEEFLCQRYTQEQTS